MECGLVGPVCVLLCGAGTCGSYECSSVQCGVQLNMGCCICPRTHELLIHVFLIIRKSYSRSDVFSAGVWSDLSSIEDPELQQLAQSLPSLVLQGKAVSLLSKSILVPTIDGGDGLA